VHAANRATTLRRLDDALAATAILGVTTNRGLLRTLLAAEAGDVERASTDLSPGSWDSARRPDQGIAYSCAAAVLSRGRAGFRLNAMPSLRIDIDGRQASVPVDPSAASALAWVRDGAAVVLDLDGLAVRATLAAAPAA
jgi:acetyl-CoA/propionyl-CoA carboxylase biotin carboxyl carrier protein